MFVSEHIDSVEQLEILLLLRAAPSREWSPEQVTAELRLGASSAQARLADLAVGGLAAESTAPVPRYRYAPRTEALDRAAAELARVYRERRVAVIQLIYSGERRRT